MASNSSGAASLGSAALPFAAAAGALAAAPAAFNPSNAPAETMEPSSLRRVEELLSK